MTAIPGIMNPAKALSPNCVSAIIYGAIARPNDAPAGWRGDLWLFGHAAIPAFFAMVSVVTPISPEQ